MFRLVVELLLSHAVLAVDRRGCEETREDVLHCLSTLRRFRAKPWNDGLVGPALLLASEDPAWSLLWSLAEIRRHARAGVCDCPPAVVEGLMASLESEFTRLAGSLSRPA